MAGDHAAKLPCPQHSTVVIRGRGLEQMPPLLAGVEILLLELKVGLGIGNKGLA